VVAMENKTNPGSHRFTNPDNK